MGSRLRLTRSDLTRVYPAAAKAGPVQTGAVLDVAFDHLLYGLQQQDVYGALDVTIKGGTALRKFYIGHRGRFSFDLDFDVAEGAGDLIAETIDGMTFPNFGFAVRERRGHYTVDVATDLLPGGPLEAKVDFSTRGLWLPPQQSPLLRTPLHAAYPIDTRAPIPVMSIDENIAEKLGRWQSNPLIRDLYDLAALSGRVADPQFVAKMWVMKRHAAMTGGGHRDTGGPAASVDELTAIKQPAEFVLDDLVLPTDPADPTKLNLIQEHLAKVHGFCRAIEEHMTPDLYRYAADRGALKWAVDQEIAAIKDSARPDRLRRRGPQQGSGGMSLDS